MKILHSCKVHRGFNQILSFHKGKGILQGAVYLPYSYLYQYMRRSF